MFCVRDLPCLNSKKHRLHGLKGKAQVVFLSDRQNKNVTLLIKQKVFEKDVHPALQRLGSQ
jgi:hypothetical protein